MAFFGLTQLGYQDTIREHVRDPDITPQYVFRSGMYRDPNWRTKLPPIDRKDSAKSCSRPSSTSSVDQQVAGYGSGHGGSHVEYTRMLNKHIRGPQEPHCIYRYPVTTSAQIGQWRKDEPLREKEPWSYVRRHVHRNSEMTRFVDEMSLTNREFSLF